MEEAKKECDLCHGTECLTQWGIFVIYLMPAKISLLLIIVSLLGVALYSSYFYLLLVLALILPLAQADFRLYLYPVVMIAKLFGKNLNCPKCNSNGEIFKNI